MSFVAGDLGASSTRFTSDGGQILVIPNNMVFISQNEEVDLEPRDEKISNALDVIIEKEGDSSYFPTRVLIGSLAERYTPNNERPSALTNKSDQKINYVSGIVITAISKILYNLDDNLDLYVALPPVDVKTSKEKVNKEFSGKYKVTLPKFDGGRVVEFTINKALCFEESSMALLSYFFTMSGLPTENGKKYLSGNVLSLDIGASTTDLAVCKNGQYLEKSGQTYKTGGNIARTFLSNEIQGKYGFDIPIEEAERVMAEGRIQLGNGYDDVSDLVVKAKQNFAKTVVNNLQTYFINVGIPIQTIRAIVVSGGGSMPSQYVKDNETVKTSEPMSFYITEELKAICKGVAVEFYGENPRYANIAGLFIRAKVDASKKKVGQPSNSAENVEAIK